MKDLFPEGIPWEVATAIQYSKTSTGLFHFDKRNDQLLKPYLTRLFENIPGMYFTRDKPGAQNRYFGSKDPAQNHLIADIFGVENYDQAQISEPISKVISQEIPKLDYLPWERLNEVGDHFFVINGDKGRMSVACHHKGKELGRTYRSHSLKGGVLIILIDKPEPSYSHLVELTNDS